MGLVLGLAGPPAEATGVEPVSRRNRVGVFKALVWTGLAVAIAVNLMVLIGVATM